MRIVEGPNGVIQFLPDEIPNPDNIPGLDSVIPTESDNGNAAAPVSAITTTATDSATETATVESMPQSDSPAVSQNQFMILRNYGHMSSEELFMTHYNREKSRASDMSDDDLLQSIAELELIVTIGKIRQRAEDDVRLERLESKSKTAKEKQKLKDSEFKIKPKRILDAESVAKDAKDRIAKSKTSDVDKLMNYLGMTREEAEAHLNKGKQ